jgi:uncharacterized integral membrane protein (TIGR00697 family)
MNEGFFFLQIAAVLVFTMAALRHSKEALIGWIILQGLLANLFVLKEISLFGFLVTPTDTYAVGAIFALNLLREKWGKEGTKGILRMQTLFFSFVIVMAIFQMAYIPSTFDTTSAAYQTILGPMPRVLAASLGCLLLVQRFDLFFYSLLKHRIPLFWKNVFCISIAEILDTLFFTFLGLFGLLSSPFDLIVVSLTVKGIIIVSLVPFTRLVLTYAKPVSV